jgi:arsenical pump membrane protein
MTLLSIYLDKVGLFRYLANITVKRFNKSQYVLFIALYFLISILTVFTSNDVIILTFTPFICYFCKHAGINPIPYLIGEFFAANTLSISLIIGNPTNIYIASIMNITFIDYLSFMFIIGITLCLALFFVLLFIFRNKLKEPMNVSNTEVKIESKPMLIVGVIHLSFATIFMAIANYINIELYLISLSSALSLSIISTIYHLIRKEKDVLLKETYKNLPYAFIPFLSSMVIIIGALRNSGIMNDIALILAKNDSVLLYSTSSFLLGNVMNNIPMSLFYSELLRINSTIITTKHIYATIVSSNLCALFTPLGSLAGMMFLGLLKNQNINFKFKNFMKYCYVSIILLFIAYFIIMIK